jgi:hypothetical protein
VLTHGIVPILSYLPFRRDQLWCPRMVLWLEFALASTPSDTSLGDTLDIPMLAQCTSYVCERDYL